MGKNMLANLMEYGEDKMNGQLLLALLLLFRRPNKVEFTYLESQDSLGG